MLRLLRAGADEGRAVVMVTHEAGRRGDRRPRPAPRDGRLVGRRDARGRAAPALRACARGAHAARRAGDRSPRRSSSAPALTVGYGLATGFDRAADAAGLPDVIARFDASAAPTVDERVRALPNLAAALLPLRAPRTPSCSPSGHFTRPRRGRHVVLGGRRGYEIVDGRDVSRRRPGEVVVERGLAREWDLHVGRHARVGHRHGRAADRRHRDLARQRRLPAGHAPRASTSPRRRSASGSASCPTTPTSRCCGSTTRARPTSRSRRRGRSSFGLGKLQFVTREGVRVLLSQAAGIVISLLVAFSLVALSRPGRCSPRARTPRSSGG